jgi:hypothetical protein
VDGAPDKAKLGKAMAMVTKAVRLCTAKLAKPKKSAAVKQSWASAGVVSCANRAKPRHAINASRPPSAKARA